MGINPFDFEITLNLTESFETPSVLLGKSGAYLMNHGISLQLHGDYASQIIALTEE